jgi:hypothetical protein
MKVRDRGTSDQVCAGAHGTNAWCKSPEMLLANMDIGAAKKRAAQDLFVQPDRCLELVRTNGQPVSRVPSSGRQLKFPEGTRIDRVSCQGPDPFKDGTIIL